MKTTHQNCLTDMVNMQQGTIGAREASESIVGTDLLESSTLTALEKLDQDGRELAKKLDDYLDSMQEDFVNTLQSLLTGENTELAERLHLHLSSEGTLVVEGEENDTEKVCSLLSDKMSIQKSFKRLSRLAMLSYGIDVTRQACGAIYGNDEDDNPLFGHYHMYIKGALSHFCIR